MIRSRDAIKTSLVEFVKGYRKQFNDADLSFLQTELKNMITEKNCKYIRSALNHYAPTDLEIVLELVMELSANGNRGDSLPPKAKGVSEKLPPALPKDNASLHSGRD